jgi:hypothetical protein
MQELAAQAAGPLAAPVTEVPGDRQAQVRQVRADLVRPAGQRVERQQGVPAAGAEHLVFSRRSPTTGHHGHALPVARVAPDRRLDTSADRWRLPAHEGQVFLLDAAVAELAHQAGLCRIGLGHHQQPARLFVEPMDDPRSTDTGDRAERLASVERAPKQGIHQRPAAVPGRRVHDQPGRLVDDQHRLVVIRDLERDRLGRQRRVRRRAELDAHLLASLEPVARAAPRAVDQGAPIAEEPLGVGPADAAHGRNGEVDAPGRSGSGDRAACDPCRHRGAWAGCGRSKKVR